MLISANNCSLLLIDVQEKLLPFVNNHAALVERCKWLIEVGKICSIPIQYSEQYPKGLGSTVATLAELLDQAHAMTKLTFSCTDDEVCLRSINKLSKQQIILIGIEAHVCVLQTAIGLQQQGKDVFVVEDAISSRNVYDKDCAVSRMQQYNINIVTREMVAFEWLHQSGTDVFKTVSQNFLKHSPK